MTRERLIDGYDAPDPDDLNHWRDCYGNGTDTSGNGYPFVSSAQAKKTDTSGGIEPITIMDLKHTTSGA